MLGCRGLTLIKIIIHLTGLLVSYHQSIQQALLPQLTSARLAVRKRTIIALGNEITFLIILNSHGIAIRTVNILY